MDPMLLIFLAVAGVVGLVVLDAAIRREDVVAVLVFSALVLEVAFSRDVVGVNVAGVRLLYADMVFVLVTAAAVGRLMRLRRWTVPQRLLLLLLALVIFSVVRGAAAFGQGAFNDVRSFLSLTAAALYFSTFTGPPAMLRRIGVVWLAAAGVIAGIVLLRWAMLVTGIRVDVLTAHYDAPIRVLSGPETFGLALAGVMLLPALFNPRARLILRWTAGAGLVMVILLNRRTVWLTVLIALAFIVFRRSDIGGRFRAVMAVAAVAVGIVLFTLSDSPDGLSDPGIGQSAVDVGTLEWRYEGWVSLLQDNGPNGVLEWVVGAPMGSGYERQVTSDTGGLQDVTTSQPHNFYVQLLVRAGVLGLVAFVALLVIAVRQQRRRGLPDVGDALLTPEVLLIMLTMQAVFMISWPIGTEHGVPLGLAVAAFWRRGQPRRATAAGEAEEPVSSDEAARSQLRTGSRGLPSGRT